MKWGLNVSLAGASVVDGFGLVVKGSAVLVAHRFCQDLWHIVRTFGDRGTQPSLLLRTLTWKM